MSLEQIDASGNDKMPRPTNKDDLIEAADDQFAKLWKLIDSMSDVEQHAGFSFDDRDRNVRDVLVHLHEWHNMMERWHRIGTLEGGLPAVPGEGYTWKTLPDLNLMIWRTYQDTPLDDSKSVLKESHARIVNLIDGHSDEELFSKGMYRWTKTTTLGAYFISSTSSHYEWAMKKIKRHIRTCRQ